ncbi:MAG: efflux RND transporter periplasmic adaptor subunit [Bacteroidales bacterium]|nr:efflux RND transporter periplasmic adaptor subunit [Bacteroidales bacterium]
MENTIKTLGVIIITALFFSACKEQITEEKTEKKVKVKTTKIVEKEISIPVHCSGKLSSKTESKLSFKTGGIISNIFVDEGQTVKKGQVLAKLNLSEIQAQVNQAKLGLEKAKRDFKRANNLYKDSVATLEQLQNATTALNIAKSNVEIAEFNLQFSTIKAPSNGKILKRIAEKNEIIGSGYPVFFFGSTENDWVVRVNITDKDIFLIKLKDNAEIKFDAYTNKIFPATVSEIGNSADPYTGTYEVELTLKPTNTKFASGLIARVDIFPLNKEKYCLVPINALIEGSETIGYIYKVINSKPEKLKIEIHHIDNEFLYVSKGINPGTEIIIEGVNYIDNGSEVEIVN